MNRSVKSLLRGAVLAPVATAVTVAAASGAFADQGPVGGSVRDTVGQIAPAPVPLEPGVSPGTGKVTGVPAKAVDAVLGESTRDTTASVKARGRVEIRKKQRRPDAHRYVTDDPKRDRTLIIHNRSNAQHESAANCTSNAVVESSQSGGRPTNAHTRDACVGQEFRSSVGKAAPGDDDSADTMWLDEAAPINGRLARPSAGRPGGHAAARRQPGTLRAPEPVIRIPVRAVVRLLTPGILGTQRRSADPGMAQPAAPQAVSPQTGTGKPALGTTVSGRPNSGPGTTAATRPAPRAPRQQGQSAVSQQQSMGLKGLPAGLKGLPGGIKGLGSVR